MTSIKTQFYSAQGGSSGYLKSSLDFMVADTRPGLDGAAAADFAVIKKYASSHPERADVAGYVARQEAAFKKPAAPNPAKPTNRM